MQTYGEFVKFKPDTHEMLKRTAYSPREAVQFRFDGWEQQEPFPVSTAKVPAPKPRTASAPKPDQTTSDHQ